MESLIVSLLSFLAIFGGALAGVWIARRIPTPHLNTETRTAISVSMAVVGTLAALVISLMISNASTSFKTRTDAIETLSLDIIKLDRTLNRYGPQAGVARDTLHTYAIAKARELQGKPDAIHAGLKNLRTLEAISDDILAFRNPDERHHEIQSRALQLVDAITDARWLLVARNSLAIPPPFLILLIFWLSLLFASFGLFAPRNATVIVALFMCAAAISGGILMILELGESGSSLIHPSTASMKAAIVEIERPVD